MNILRERRFGLVSVTFFLVLAGTMVTSARGDSFGGGPPNEGYRADNFEHTYCFHSNLNGNGYQSAASYGMNNLSAQTNFYKNYMDPCTFNTDVKFKKNSNLPPRILADYTCQDFEGSRCRAALIRYNPPAIGNSTSQKNSTSCHEVGHTGGLRHGDPSDCMTNNYSSNIHYNGHHVAHLNNQ